MRTLSRHMLVLAADMSLGGFDDAIQATLATSFWSQNHIPAFDLGIKLGVECQKCM